MCIILPSDHSDYFEVIQYVLFDVCEVLTNRFLPGKDSGHSEIGG